MLVSKYIKPVFVIALGIYLFDQTRIWISGGQWGGFTLELQKFGIYFIYSFVIGTANMLLVRKLDRMFPWKEIPKKRAIFGALGAVIVSMISIIALRVFTVLLIENNTWQYFITHESALMYFYSLILTLVIVLVFYVINFYKTITKQTITKHKVVAKTESAKYETLKSQLDPHFLFNSLNVLTSLIEENPQKAEAFTAKLSRVYRYVLEQKDKDLVLLNDELDFAKNYMELLQMRFEGSLLVDMPEVASRPNYKIVPLALQMLLENAVKHNSLSTTHPLRISIKEENGQLVITNNYTKKEGYEGGTGIGLHNIIDRYALLTEKEISIKKSTDSFIVKLPLLTQKSKIYNMKTNQENSYLEAREQVERIKEFYTNLISFCIIIPILVYINYSTYWGYKWFIFPLIGWGIGLFFSYLKAYNRHLFLGQDWEKRKIEEILEEDAKEMWK